MSDLAPKDRISVMTEITKTDVPESLKELRPEDVDGKLSFFSNRLLSEHSHSLTHFSSPPLSSLAMIPVRVLEERKPPSTLTQDLLPFQKEGLGWMMDQELSEVVIIFICYRFRQPFCFSSSFSLTISSLLFSCASGAEFWQMRWEWERQYRQ